MHLKCWKRTHYSNFFGTFSSQRKHQETIRHCVWLAGTFDMCDIICHTKFHIISRPYRILNWQLCVWQRYFLLQVSPPAWSNFSLSIWPFFFFWQLCALILQVPLRAWSEFCVWNVVWIFKCGLSYPASSKRLVWYFCQRELTGWRECQIIGEFSRRTDIPAQLWCYSNTPLPLPPPSHHLFEPPPLPPLHITCSWTLAVFTINPSCLERAAQRGSYEENRRKKFQFHNFYQILQISLQWEVRGY